jgi:hypothetical protein
MWLSKDNLILNSEEIPQTCLLIRLSRAGANGKRKDRTPPAYHITATLVVVWMTQHSLETVMLHHGDSWQSQLAVPG